MNKNSEKKDSGKRKLIVRIVCGFLAFLMIASTLFYIIYYLVDAVKNLTV